MFFVALVAFPSVASAMPPENTGRQWSPPPLVQPDVAVPSHLPAKGTDVAAPDQQASKPGPASVSSSTDSGVDARTPASWPAPPWPRSRSRAPSASAAAAPPRSRADVTFVRHGRDAVPDGAGA